jgi:hypothetical protein
MSATPGVTVGRDRISFKLTSEQSEGRGRRT